MEGLNLDYITDGDELDLFGDSTEQPATPEEPSTPEEPKNDKTDTAEEVNVDDLFTPESVGGGKDNKEKEDDTPSSEGDGSSPDKNFFSSNAKALAEEGIFPDLDEETINGIKTAEDLRKAIETQMQAGLSDIQKRVNDALNAGVEPTAIKQYENTLSFLNSIDDKQLEAEGDKAEDLRKRLIMQDFLNRGFDKTRAEREVSRALQNGTDVDDAKEALKSNRDYFKKAYDDLVQEAKDEQDREVAERQARAASIKDKILDSKNKFFGELELDKATRQKVFDSISKPIYKDPESGEMLTAVQKYEAEHKEDFLVKIGLLFTLTDNFKSLDGLVKGKVNKEMKKGFSALESKINNTARDNDGNLRFTSGVSDSEDYLGKGIKLDI